MRLKELVEASAVLRIYEADVDDLELLAIVEDSLKGGQDGEGC